MKKSQLRQIIKEEISKILVEYKITHPKDVEMEIENKKQSNTFPFEVRDEDGNLIHYQETKGKWVKYKNKGGKRVGYESWTGYFRDGELGIDGKNQ